MAKDGECELDDKACDRVLFWSNPDLVFPPSGVRWVGRGPGRASNNAETLRKTAPVVANFRCRKHERHDGRGGTSRLASPEPRPAQIHRKLARAVEPEELLDERVLDGRGRERAEASRRREQAERLREVACVEKERSVGHLVLVLPQAAPEDGRHDAEKRRSPDPRLAGRRPHGLRPGSGPGAAGAARRRRRRSDTGRARGPARSRRGRSTRSDEASPPTGWSSSGECRRARRRGCPFVRTFPRRRPRGRRARRPAAELADRAARYERGFQDCAGVRAPPEGQRARPRA